MKPIWQDILQGLRSVVNSPRVPAFAVMTLALAIGASSAVFSLYDNLVLRPLPFQEPERLVHVMGRVAANAEYVAVRDRMDVFDEVAAYAPAADVIFSTEHSPERINAARISSNLFSTLGLQPSLGRDLRRGEDGPDQLPLAILSHTFWRQRFESDPAAIGQTLVLDGQPHEIIGVMTDNARFPSRETELWLPLRLDESDLSEYWASPKLQIIGRLGASTEIAEATAALRALAAQLRLENPLWTPDESYVDRVTIEALKTHVSGSAIAPLNVLMAAVVLVLLLACANLAGLFIARSIQRQHTWAIRTALGANRIRLVVPTLAEVLWIAIPGGLLGLALAWLTVRIIPGVVPMNIPSVSSFGLDGRVLAFTLLVTVLATLIAGLAPALRAIRHQPQALLAQGKGSGGRAGGRLASALVAAQIGLAVVLLIGAGLLLRTLGALGDVNPGFDTENVLTLKLDTVPGTFAEAQAMRTFHSDLLERVSALDPVEYASLTSLRPLADIGSEVTAFDLRHDPQGMSNLPMALYPGVSPDYFRAMGVSLIEGRFFDTSDRADAAAVTIVSQSLARRFFGDDSPIGQQLGHPWSNDWWTIVGVVGDVRYEALDGPGTFSNMAIYRPMDQQPTESVFLAVRTRADPKHLLPDLRTLLDDNGSETALSEIYSASDLIAHSTSQPRFITQLLAGFGVAALVLAMTGIYGMLIQLVSRSRHEIGVRLSVGAAQHHIVGQIVQRALLLSSAGIGLGLLVALAVSRFLESILFGVSATDWSTFIIVALILLTTALLAAIVPALQASRTDPLQVLRAD